jgi:hypothetical protein
MISIFLGSTIPEAKSLQNVTLNLETKIGTLLKINAIVVPTMDVIVLSAPIQKFILDCYSKHSYLKLQASFQSNMCF